MSFVFNEKFSYPYLEILKKYESKFDKESKTWSVPLKYKVKFNNDIVNFKVKESEKKQEKWKEACEAVGVKFASKGTEDYDEVLKVFKELIAV